MPQPDHVSIYDLPDPETLDEDMKRFFNPNSQDGLV